MLVFADNNFHLLFEICIDDIEFNDIDSGSDSLSSEKYVPSNRALASHYLEDSENFASWLSCKYRSGSHQNIIVMT